MEEVEGEKALCSSITFAPDMEEEKQQRETKRR